MQVAVFNEGEEALAAATPRATELDAFFLFNSQPLERAKARDERPRYVDMPEQHVYKKGQWMIRKSGPPVIGRVHMPCVLAGETIYLRMLLHDDACRGAESFEQLRQGQATYKEACRVLGLLQVGEYRKIQWSRTITSGTRHWRRRPGPAGAAPS